MTLYIITGPPAAGKSTWVKEHAKHGDITIDFDAIAATLTPNITPHDPPKHVLDVAIIARQAAINAALLWSKQIDVYLIHTLPSSKQLAHYRRYGAEFITIDPGYETCITRARTERPAQSVRVIDEWYASRQSEQPPYARANW